MSAISEITQLIEQLRDQYGESPELIGLQRRKWQQVMAEREASKAITIGEDRVMRICGVKIELMGEAL
jgi:hypothetical protein